MYFISEYLSPLGLITIASDEQYIIGLWFNNQKYFMKNIINKEYIVKETDVIIKTKSWLNKYFNKENPDIKELPIKLIGTPFQKEIWNILKEIPYGETTTYKNISEIVKKQRNQIHMSSQAVGGAVSHNPISIIIPCHRVISTNGSLTGYAGGLNIKEKLLSLEGIKIKNNK